MIKLLSLLLLLQPLVLQAETYQFSGGRGNLAQAIASEILVKAYSQAGIKIEPLFLNLEESLQRSNAGVTDGELARIEKITGLYPNLRLIPVSVVYVEAVAFSNNPLLQIDKWEDLRDHKLVIVKGAKFIEKATEQLPKQVVSTFEDAFELIDKNQAEIVVVPKLAGWNVIHTKKYKNMRMVSTSLKKVDLYHFVHKKNSHLIPLITPYLKKMERSGEIAFKRSAQLRRFSKNF